MNYEYKTEELKMYYTEQERVMNELAHEGWELISVSFNIGYFRRPNATINLNKPPTFVKYGDTVLDGRSGQTIYIDEASTFTDLQLDEVKNKFHATGNKTIKGKGKKQ